MPTLLKSFFQKYDLRMSRKGKNIYSFLDKHYQGFAIDFKIIIRD